MKGIRGSMSLIHVPLSLSARLIMAKADETPPASEVRQPRKRLTDPITETGPRVGEPGTLDVCNEKDQQLEFDFSSTSGEQKQA